MSEHSLLAEQLTYYRARAPEYDEWWERRGRYGRGEAANDRWRAEIAEVRKDFDTLDLSGEVLELAAGTGYWTEILAARASRLTVLDGSAEMLAINRARLGDAAAPVEYSEVNLFDWQPPRRWDGVVFCFWISHVPRDRIGAFFATCRKALVKGGPLFFLDGQRVPETTATDHVLPDEDTEVMVRRLNDGREFRIVKNFYAPEELLEAATAAGFDLEVHRTSTYFQYGVGRAR